MKTAKTIKFITEMEVLFTTDLKERLDITVEDVDLQDLFSSDPDLLKTENGTVPFIVITENDVTYIITQQELEDNEKEVVNWWLEGAENELPVPNTRASWYAAITAIAYRGGSGYTYALHVKS
jgi:hypothetical protein